MRRCCLRVCGACWLVTWGRGWQEREEERERSASSQWQLNAKSRELLAAKGRLSTNDGDIVSRLMEQGNQQRLKVGVLCAPAWLTSAGSRRMPRAAPRAARGPVGLLALHIDRHRVGYARAGGESPRDAAERGAA